MVAAAGGTAVVDGAVAAVGAGAVAVGVGAVAVGVGAAVVGVGAALVGVGAGAARSSGMLFRLIIMGRRPITIRLLDISHRPGTAMLRAPMAAQPSTNSQITSVCPHSVQTTAARPMNRSLAARKKTTTSEINGHAAAGTLATAASPA
jgi:hypothetical protein